MALRGRSNLEDVVIGTFVLLAFLYPFVITFLIRSEEAREHVGWRDRLRITYLFLSGLEECTTQRATEVARFFDRGLLKELGGVEGILNVCRENKTEGDVRLEERFESVGDVYVLKVSITSELRKYTVEVYGRVKDGELKVTGVEQHAEGD